jgi:hypothetical protein
MRAPYLVTVALTLVLAGCGGGGGTGGSNAPVAPIAGPVVPSSATFPLTITVPARVVGSAARAPRYVSPGTASVVVYEGTAVLYVGNFNAAANPQFTTVFAKTGTTAVTAGTCTAVSGGTTCTLTIVTTVGAHTYDVVTYPQSQGAQATSVARTVDDVGTLPTSFRGVILSEGELSVNLSPGTNPAQTITLLGVADLVSFTGPVLTLHLNGTGPLVGLIGTQYTFQYTINDSSGNQIVLPGNYDNGPVTIAETDGGNIVTMTPISSTAPPAASGNQSFTVTCANNGTATITAAAQNKPNATYVSGLTYTSANYSSGTLGTTTIQCVPNSATLPVTIQ